jgi:hypothetical protein
MERAALTTTDADKGVAELKTLGFAALGPYDFGRPVDLPDGRRTEARFRTFVWPISERPGDLRIFACQHLTRDNVWLPSLTRHANTASAIDRVEVLARDPRAAAAHMGRLMDQEPVAEADGALSVATGGRRGRFVFLDRATLARRHPGVALDGVPEEGAVTLALKVLDIKAAQSALKAHAPVVGVGAVTVPPAAANGVILELSA